MASTAVTGVARTAFPAQDYPDLLNLPDHLVFAGEAHLRDYLTQSGFSAVSTAAFRVDTAAQFGKNLIKAALGRRIKLTLPYRSPFRRLLLRARIAEAPLRRAPWHPLQGLDAN